MRRGHKQNRTVLAQYAAMRWCMICSGLLLVEAALAQPGGDQRELERLERELESVRSSQAEQVAASKRLEQETDSLSEALVETAARISAQEKALIEAERRMSGLLEQEHRTAEQLADRQLDLGALLGAMQTLERQRPPALLVSPDDAVKAVQSAILLDEIVPELMDQAARLAEELSELRALREDIVAEQTVIAAAGTKLEYERQRIEQLLSLKIEQQSDLQKLISEDRQRIEELAARATTLKALIQGLDVTASDPSGAAAPDQRDGNDQRRARRAALLRFSDAKGSLHLPVRGNILVRFGARTPDGNKALGVSLETRENAQVIAPFDGRIVFAGPFMEYEQLLLIEVGEGYHILLTGMSRIYGKLGDRLLAGEPVGTMGAALVESGAQASEAPPRLYLELRKNGDPIDPMPWLAVNKNKVGG